MSGTLRFVGLCMLLLTACTGRGADERVEDEQGCHLGTIFLVAGPERQLVELNPCTFETTPTDVADVNTIDASGDVVVVSAAPEIFDELFQYADGSLEPIPIPNRQSLHGPAISPDGRLAYLTIDRSIKPFSYRIEVVQLDALDVPATLVAEYGYPPGGPEWSANGEVAVLESPEGEGESSESVGPREIALYGEDGSRAVFSRFQAPPEAGFFLGPDGYFAYADGKVGWVGRQDASVDRLANGWFASDWSPPHAALILVNGGQVAIADPPTFAITDAKDLNLGTIWAAVWARPASAP